MRINKLNILILLAPFVLAGCLQVKTEPDISGGLYRSRDKGQTFEAISNIDSVSGGKNFAQDSVEYLGFDVTDPNTIYYSSREQGLFVSHNSGSSWKNVLANKGTVRNVIVDPNEPCHIYAQTSQNIFKSNDCGRRWSNVYLEKIKDRIINDIDIDPNAPNRFFMSLSDGSILVSDDHAVSWRVWYRFDIGDKDEVVNDLYINPKNSQNMYAATTYNFYSSTDGGVSWTNLRKVINEDFEFDRGSIVSNLVFLSEYDNGFYTVSRYGVLKSSDGGVSWSELPLLPQPERDDILSIAVNPANMNELYYGTAKGIYYSQDGGVNWQTLASPTTRYNKAIIMHPKDSSVIYVGAYLPAK